MAWVPQRVYDVTRHELERLTPEEGAKLDWAEASARFVLADTTMMGAWKALRDKYEGTEVTPYQALKELWRIP